MRQIKSCQIHDPNAYFETTELELMQRVLPLENAVIVELGCGRAWMTRRMAEDFPVQRVVATEVDRVQHEKNLAIDGLQKVEFQYGGMQQIDLEDGEADIVIMLKSLHHVPLDLMDQGFAEISRVLKPGGLAYISEPVYAGDFNEILRLFNDEKMVREEAFAAVKRALDSGAFELEDEIFFESPGHYASWEEFEDRMLKVTHTRHEIDGDLYEKIKASFMQHMTTDGAFFKKPSRVDLLRKAL